MNPIHFTDAADQTPDDRSASPPCPISTPDEGLDVRALDVDGVAVVAVAGEIDPTTADLFRITLEQACSRSPRVILDLSGVTFIDSTGINALVHAHQSTRAPDALVLRSLSPCVRRLLALTGLDQIMTIEDDHPDQQTPLSQSAEPERTFDIANRDAGQVIDITMRQAVTVETWAPTEDRLLNLIAARQPAELHIELGADRPPDQFARGLERLSAALADFGGTLTVSPALETGLRSETHQG